LRHGYIKGSVFHKRGERWCRRNLRDDHDPRDVSRRRNSTQTKEEAERVGSSRRRQQDTENTVLTHVCDNRQHPPRARHICLKVFHQPAVKTSALHLASENWVLATHV
jgi:hypothetical protein